MDRILILAPALALLAACATGGEEAKVTPVSIQAATPEEAGRYFFLIGGCNDCHTPGWAESNGRLPEAEWAVGGSIGYRGPWGVSYPDNLRLAAQALTEQQWVDLFRKGEGSPPMPWQNYRNAPTADLAGIYRFLRSLGPRAKPAPGDLPPGKEPTTTYIDLAPHRPVPNGP
jgi:hypothetical protein